MADVVVVGGGVGGLAAALRLRAAGHAVRVLERRAALGGKLDVRVRDGFTFDTGPSLLTLPDVLDELFRVAGTRLAAEVDLTRLDPQIRYRWPDGSGFDACDDPEATSRAVEAFSPGGGAAHRRFTAHGERIWAVSERTFLAGPMSGPLDLLRRMRSPRDLTAIDPLRTLDAVARRTFSDPRLVQWAGRYATYSGSSPYRAPATLACIPAVEARHGVWYPAGGMGTLRDALVRVADRTGVELATGCEVERIEASGDRVRAVVTADGTRHRADVVVANVDAEHLYRDLLPDGRALTRTRRAGRSLSGFVVLAGVRGTTPGQAHHTVWFPADEAREFRQLVDEGVAGRPADHLRLRAVGQRPHPGATRPRELVPARQRAGRRGRRSRRLPGPPVRAAGRRTAPTSATACASRRRSRPPTWPTATGRREARSTEPRRTVAGPRSSVPPTAGRGAACTWSAAPATLAAGSRSWRSAGASSPTSSARTAGERSAAPAAVGGRRGAGWPSGWAWPALAVSRLARAARRRPPLVVEGATVPTTTISVVIPARDEAARIGPLLEALRGDPTVTEVLVVDDESSDGTAELAGRLGATVLTGAPLPAGWVGKPWALDQGLRAASGEWVVTMDADVEPAPGCPAPSSSARRATAWTWSAWRGASACPTPALRWLHPALLTTLVYRFGPAGAIHTPRPSRVLANGQCTAFRRQALLDAGGYDGVAGHLTDDIALARHLAARGWRTALLDGTSALTVRMHDDAADAWRHWGRSLPMPDATAPGPQLLDLATLARGPGPAPAPPAARPRRCAWTSPSSRSASARWPAPAGRTSAPTCPTGCRRWPIPRPSVESSGVPSVRAGPGGAGPTRADRRLSGGPMPPPARTAAR